MPFVVVCPECNAQLKSNALVPAGRTIACPSCKTKFTTERDSKEIGGTGSKASVSVPPAPPPKPKAKPSRNDEEDFEDEEDDRPKKKVKASRDDEDFDDEDDRPKKKSKSSRNEDFDDDEDDDRPTKKKSSKNRDDDDEDEEDRPRSKKKGKKKPQKSKLPLILGLAGGGGLALLGILTLVLFLTDTFPFNKKEDKKVLNNPPQGGGPNNPIANTGVGNTATDLIKIIPTNYNSIAAFDLDQIRKDPVLIEASKGMGEAFAFGFDASNIQKVFIFGVLDDEKNNGCVILKLKPNTDMSKFDQTYGAKATTINGLKAYDLDMGLWYFADQTTLVMGKKDQLSATIGKPQTPSALMQEVAKKATGAFTMGAAGIDEEGPFEKLLQGLSGKNNPPQKQKTIWGVINSNIKPNHSEQVEIYTYENPTIANSEHQKLTTALDSCKKNLNVLLNRIRSGQLKVDDSPEEVKMAIETAKITLNGATLTITYNQPKNAEKFSK